MGYWNTQVYAVPGQDRLCTDIIHNFIHVIVSKFPTGTFKKDSIIIDTLDYKKDTSQNKLGNLSNEKISKVRLNVTSNGMSDNWNLDNIPNVLTYEKFPGVVMDRSLYSPNRDCMIHDAYNKGIILDTINMRRKVELNLEFVLNSKSDLETMRSASYNCLPMNVNSILRGLVGSLIFPNSIMNDIIKMTFIKNSFDCNDETHIESLLNYIHDNGFYRFEPSYRKNDLWFITNRNVILNYRLSSADGDGGDNKEQDGDIYDEFSFNLSCNLDFEVPNSYVLHTKTINIVNRSFNTPEYIESLKLNDEANLKVDRCLPKYIETRPHIKRPSNSNMILTLLEEFILSDINDSVSLMDWAPDDSILKTLLIWLKPNERKKLIDVHIYENDIFMDDSYISRVDDSDVTVSISGGDLNKIYLMCVYIDLELFKKKYVKRVFKRIKALNYPNVDINGDPITDPFVDNGGSYSENSFLEKSIDIIPPNKDVSSTKFSFNNEFKKGSTNTFNAAIRARR